jgi:hypothetical protein
VRVGYGPDLAETRAISSFVSVRNSFKTGNIAKASGSQSISEPVKKPSANTGCAVRRAAATAASV